MGEKKKTKSQKEKNIAVSALYVSAIIGQIWRFFSPNFEMSKKRSQMLRG